jgi:hypothetical protein
MFDDDFLGPVRRWREGDSYYAENDVVRIAWVYTDDPAKVGTFGWHGPQQIGVEYVARPKIKI